MNFQMNIHLQYHGREQKLPGQAEVCRSYEEFFLYSLYSIKKAPDKTPWLQFWAPCFRKGVNYLERTQWWAMRMTGGLQVQLLRKA